MEASTHKLLTDIGDFMYAMGVVSGQGKDGELLARIAGELEGAGVDAPRGQVQLPTGGPCPLCLQPILECDCDPAAQMAELERMRK